MVGSIKGHRAGDVGLRSARVKEMFVLFALLALMLGAMAILAPYAGAAHGFTVNSTDDQVDAAPGDGICVTSDVENAPECTLRAAIQEANAHAGPDTITVPSGTYARTIAGDWEDAAATGDLDITSDVTVQGAGRQTTIIDAEKLDRVLHVVSGTLVLEDLTVTDGRSPNAHGAGIRIEPNSTAQLVDVAVDDNELAIRAWGGGIANWGTLTVTGGSISNNVSAGGGGGLFNDGPLATLTGVLLDQNQAYDPGGAIYTNQNKHTTLEDSTVSGNYAYFEGGGLASIGYTHIRRSTISGNSSAHQGGGFAQAVNCAAAGLDITNSTISGNAGAGAGGLFLACATDLRNVTITGNDATHAEREDDDLFVYHGTTTISNSIVAGAGSKNCDVRQSPSDTTFTSGGYNISSDGTCFSAGGTDLSNTDPKLGALADNGGPTKTHALPADSPAVDFVAESNCPPPAVDQRGEARPSEGNGAPPTKCDAGSFERVDADGDGYEAGDVTETNDANPCIPSTSAGPCDADDDGVTVAENDPDNNDACVPNASGTPNADGDTLRDECDPDADGDGVSKPDDIDDTNPCAPNQGGSPDADGDNVRDACDPDDDDGPNGDLDDDGTNNLNDPNDSNACVPNAGGTPDADGDNQRDACDANDNDGPTGDLDNDGTNNADDADDTDACVPNNGGSQDADGDGIRDVCDPEDEDGPLGDLDGDGINNANDGCPGLAEDEDGKADVDGCPDVAAKTTVTIDYLAKKDVVKGNVSSKPSYASCENGRPVSLWRQKPDKDAKLATKETNDNGGYSFPIGEKVHGKLYVKLTKKVVTESDGTVVTCGPKESDTVSIP